MRFLIIFALVFFQMNSVYAAFQEGNLVSFADPKSNRVRVGVVHSIEEKDKSMIVFIAGTHAEANSVQLLSDKDQAHLQLFVPHMHVDNKSLLQTLVFLRKIHNDLKDAKDLKNKRDTKNNAPCPVCLGGIGLSPKPLACSQGHLIHQECVENQIRCLEREITSKEGLDKNQAEDIREKGLPCSGGSLHGPCTERFTTDQLALVFAGQLGPTLSLINLITHLSAPTSPSPAKQGLSKQEMK